MPKRNRRKSTGIQGWMDSRAGQMFLNYAYSWGAAIVILGALFKLTHIHGADLMLFIGMGTEVIVFFLSGFERPWSDDGRDDDEDDDEYDEDVADDEEEGTVIENMWDTEQDADDQQEDETEDDADMDETVQEGTGKGKKKKDAAQLASAIAAVNVPTVQGMTPEMQQATDNYVTQLNELTETLKKVAEQSARLTRDSEEMETMNRTLTGINRFYEMQLRSVGQQSSTIDEVNEQTKHLAKQLEELNSVYARMVEALKMNMNMKSGE